MKKLIILVVMGFFLLSFVSADISLINEPKSLYNLNDKMELNIKIVPNPLIENLVTLKLACGEEEIEIYKEYLILSKDVSKKIVVPLVKEFIKSSIGECLIVSTVGNEEKILSNPFILSNKLILSIDESSREMNPGNVVSLIGEAVRENKKVASGIVEVEIVGEKSVFGNSKLIDSKFVVNIPIPDNFKSGNHQIKIRAYEKNKFDQITNEGEMISTINIVAIPTNLEIILNKKGVNPKEYLSGIVILRDQTGEKINSKVYLVIKNEKNEIVKKIESNTGEEFSYTIPENEAPNNFKISAYSDEIISSIDFKILENKEISIDMINKTLIIKNVGNVYYNDTAYIDVGNKSVPVKVNLEVGATEKYNIYAPNGEYKITFGKNKRVTTLTGNAIKIEKIGINSFGFVEIFVWIFIILILGFVAYIYFKKGNKKTFFGRKTGRTAKKPIELRDLPISNSLLDSKIKGELSISITGTRQNSPIGCISIKNYEEIKDGLGGVSETLNKISVLIENKKGVIYENNGNIFYILAPIKTKTFNNEIPILKISKNIKELFEIHNKKFKQKIDFGIGLNYGTIITKEECKVFKFMSMGTLMTMAKKVANRSGGIILMNDKFKEKLDLTVKFTRVEIDGMNVFKFNSIIEKKDNSAFINNFLKKNKFN